MAASGNLLSNPLQAAAELSRTLSTEACDDEERTTLATLLSEVRKYCVKHVDGGAIDKRASLGPEMLKALAERGWFGLTIPERFGGAGLSMKAATRVVAELAAYNGSLGTCIGLHSGLALYSLIHLASPELQQRYLPAMAAGERIAAFAATEPGAGSDIAAMRATLSERGEVLRLNGSKCYVTNGGVCGVVTVVARSPGLGGAKAGHSLVVVDPGWAGVVRGREENKLGLKGSSTITIDFDDVEIPRDHVIGEFSKGLEYAHRALTWGRTFMAAGCLGASQAALVEARTHTEQRVQFGRPLLQFPLVREQLASAMADVYATESVIRLVCDLFDTRRGDIALDSTVAKVRASEVAWQVTDRGLQLMGGTGYIEDAGMARRLRDMRVTRIFEGANDVLRLHLASATLGWRPESLRSLPALAPIVASELKPSADAFDRLVGEFVQRLIGIRATYGFKLFERQALQSIMADGLIDLYAMMATLIRASGSASSAELAMAKLACSRLRDSVSQHLRCLEHGADAAGEALFGVVLGDQKPS